MSGVVWFPPRGHVTWAGAQTQDTQKVIVNEIINSPSNSDQYTGVIVGGEIFIAMQCGENHAIPPTIYVLIQKSQTTEPQLITELNCWDAQDFVWLMAHGVRDGSSATFYSWQFKLTTKRRFNYGDAVKIILVNNDSTAIGVTTKLDYLLDLYIVPD